MFKKLTLLAALLVAAPSWAALPSTYSIGTVVPTQHGVVNSKYRDGVDPTPPSDSAAPTIPQGLTPTDNQDGTGTLSWVPSSDPQVSGVNAGVVSYRLRLGGVDAATISAPTANAQGALTAYRIGAADGESSSQAASNWTLTYGGTGLLSTADGVYGRLIAVTGDFVATGKISAYTPTSGTTGSIGITARASNSVEGAIAAYARWRDSDDKCNLRYRASTNGAAANGTFSSAYTVPLWVMLTRVGDVFSSYCSTDGNTFTLTSSATIVMGATAYVGPFITGGATGVTATGTVQQFNIHSASNISYVYTGAGGSFTVSAYDGTNRSNESAAVTLTPTGGSGGGGGGATGTAPDDFVVTRPTSTSATIEWKAPVTGTAPELYRVYQSDTETGTYSLVWSGIPTPDDSIYTTTISTGIGASSEPWFKVAGVVSGTETDLSAARKLSVGTLVKDIDTVSLWRASDTAPVAQPPFVASTTSSDSFSTVDNVSNPDQNGGDLGMKLVNNRVFGGHWAFRTQLTHHNLGTNSPDSSVTSQKFLPGGTQWATKASGTGATEKAHRNEFSLVGGYEAGDVDEGEEHWMGFAIFLPGESDALGDAPTRARTSIPGFYSFGPQLHPLNIPDDPNTPGVNEARSFSPELSLSHGTGGYAGYGGINPYRTQHPTGAPVIRFRRGDSGSEVLGAVSAATISAAVNCSAVSGHTTAKTNDGATLYIEWDAVPSATTYKVEAAWRPEGAWAEVSSSGPDNITVDLTNRCVIVTGLATNGGATSSTATNSASRYIRVTPMFSGTPGVTSLIAPAPMWHWTWSGADFSIDARDDYGSWVRWVVRYKRSSSNAGILEIWKDDVKVFSGINNNYGSNIADPAYWKFGIYHGRAGGNSLTTPSIGVDWPWRRVIYFDELKYGVRTGGTTSAVDTSDSVYQWVRPRGPRGE